MDGNIPQLYNRDHCRPNVPDLPHPTPMPPAYRPASPHPARLVYTLFSITIQWLPRIFRNILGYSNGVGNTHSNHVLTKRAEFNPHEPKYIVFAVLIPVLVLLSGLFAGLTLGYMSLDETQLNVLSLSGTPCVDEVHSLTLI